MNPNYVFIRGQFFSVEYAKQHRNTCCELVKGVFLEKKSNIILYTCQLFGSQMREIFIWILAEFSKKIVTTLACIAGGIVCEGKVLVAEPPRAAKAATTSGTTANDSH